MHRTQVQLTDAQMRRVKAAAADRGVSMAEVLRQLVDEHLTDAAATTSRHRQRALSAVGRHRSGLSTVSGQHDRELGDAFSK